MSILRYAFIAFLGVLAACAEGPGFSQNPNGIVSYEQVSSESAFGIAGGTLVSKAKDTMTLIVKSQLAFLHQDGYMPHCAGVQIAPRLILTVAHCLYDIDAADWIPLKDLQVGTCVSKKSEGCDWIKVKKTYIHDKYSLSSKGGKDSIEASDNDIALILLEKPSKNKKFLPLSSVAPREGEIQHIYGVGRIRDDADLDRMMRTTQLPTASIEDLFKNPGILFGRFVTTIGVKNGICQGDSGGPSFALRNGQPEVTGLAVNVVYGRPDQPCGAQLATFMDISYYRDWIEENSKRLLE